MKYAITLFFLGLAHTWIGVLAAYQVIVIIGIVLLGVSLFVAMAISMIKYLNAPFERK